MLITLGSVDILTILIYPIFEHGMPFRLSVSLIFFSSICWPHPWHMDVPEPGIESEQRQIL